MRITIDAHNDTLLKLVNPETRTLKAHLSDQTPFHIDLEKMLTGNVNAACFAAFTDDLGGAHPSNSAIASLVAALEETIAHSNGKLVKAYTFSTLQDAVAHHIPVAIQTIEGAYGVDEVNAIPLLQQYHDWGVKAITLVWNHSNALGNGTLKTTYLGEAVTHGLTALGKRFIAEMHRLKMLVDVSHMDERTFWDVIDHASFPIIASHSGAYQIHPHIRNLKDDQIKAIAATGGIVHVVFCRYFIGDESADCDVLIDHISHMIELVGDRHVGLGSDFDGATMPVNLPDMSHIQLIATKLQEKGYSQETIDRVMGGNLYRLLESLDSDFSSVFKVTIDCQIVDNAMVFSLEHDALKHADYVFHLNGYAYPATYHAPLKKLYAKVPYVLEPSHFFATFSDLTHHRRFCSILTL